MSRKKSNEHAKELPVIVEHEKEEIHENKTV
jgi:hypothetical protein